jgi:putative endopeptidase
MKITGFCYVLIISILSLSVACKNGKPNTIQSDPLAANMDTTVKPGNDFFMYASGGWIKANPIPAEQSSWGIGNLVVEENLKRLRTICESAAKKNNKKGSPEQLIGDYWKAAMDSVGIERDGLNTLKPWLDSIDRIQDINGLLQFSAAMKKVGSYTFFSDFVSQDAKNSAHMAYHLWQGGLGLPEREYYFKTDSTGKSIRTAYEKYIALLLSYVGADSVAAANAARNILAMETQMAKNSKKLEDLRDPYKNYHKMALHEINQLNRSFNWQAYFQKLELHSVDSIIVGQPEFFKSLDKILSQLPIQTGKAYLKFNLVSDFSAALPDKFGLAAFEFNRLFSGVRERKPRWKRVISQEESRLGELMGKLYVKEFFTEKAKKRYDEMVENIKAALRERITQLPWMSDSTKQKALIKLAAIRKKVGYPDQWKDFSAMNINANSWLTNMMQAGRWWYAYEINKLGKPVDRNEWSMYPQTYNAYYNPSNNEIVLPAGIFTVPGYRDEVLDDATVYGYAGASTIGHEITHGFDDEGRQFDATGNLVSWWTAKDEAAFKNRAEKIIRQFDAFEPLPGLHINGKATTGENIADLGGVLLGLDAYRKTEEYKADKPVAGLKPVQRYFLGYALGWLGHSRQENLRNQLLTDVHSPEKYRVNAPFQNVDDFYNAFSIKPGDRLFVADSARVRIW